jgi:hypothetical protein
MQIIIQSPGRRRRTLPYSLVGTALLIAAGGAFSPILGIGAGSCMGYQDVAMQRLQACPKAVQLLGPGIQPSVIGWSCGSAQLSGAFGQASWDMPVHGQKASGRYAIAAQKQAAPWVLRAATLTARGQSVDVLACSAAANPAFASTTSPGSPTHPASTTATTTTTTTITTTGGAGHPGTAAFLRTTLGSQCQQNNAGACFSLALFYERGQQGLPRNPTLAVTYYDRACRLNHSLSCREAARLRAVRPR